MGCENIEVIRENLKTKNMTIEDFKEEHRQEGTFTDKDGIMAMTTALYLGITLRIIAKTNNKINPYTEYNKGKPHIFYIFHDVRGPGHFQSLKHPKIKKTPQNRYSLGDSSENENDMNEAFNYEKKDTKANHVKEEIIKEIQEIISCDKCNKTFHNIKHLRNHHLRFDKLQCVFCHEEVSNEYEFRIHEGEHQDTENYYKCNICEEKYKSEPEARLHAYCHNPFEILKQIKKFEINLYNQMLDVSPDIMAQSKNEFILKQQNDREKRIEHEDSLKKAAKEVAKTRKEKDLNDMNAEKEAIEVKQALEESLRETKEEDIKAEKEALEVEKALEESLRESKEKAMQEIIKQEELKKKTNEETLAIKRNLEENKKKAREEAQAIEEELKESIKKAREETLEINRKLEESKERIEKEKQKEIKEKAKQEEDRLALNKKIKEENELKEKRNKRNVLQAEEENLEIERKLEESKIKAQEEALAIEKDLKESIKKAREETLEITRKLEESKKETPM